MKRHLLKLMWHRKRENALVVAEIFVSFLVLFVLVGFASYFTANYRKPLGFEPSSIWRVELGTHGGMAPEEQGRRYATILAELERLPEVRRAGAIMFPPYFFGSREENMGINGRSVLVESNHGTDGLDEVLGMRLVHGRWFGPDDDAANWKPVVIDASLALAAFGRTDVAGERARFIPEEQGEHRVVGVIETFRKGGELSSGTPYLFFRARRDGGGEIMPHVLLKMREGVDPSFEETLVRRLSAIAPGWSFIVEPLERERASSLRMQIVPLAVGGIVAAFLILMVALGLTGIMWQTVTRRTREIGLRRVVGADARGVYAQVVFETTILAGAGILLGLAVALQLPLIGVTEFFGTRIYLAAVFLSSGTIVGLAVLCGLYPGWLASRVQPAEALRYE